MITKRSLIAGGAATLAGFSTAMAQTVPNSSGSTPPKLKAPANFCDSHHHIYDARFPPSPHWKGGRPDSAAVADYRLLQRKLGIVRHVIVQPSTYGADNRCLLDALQQFGAEARGIVVIDETVTDADLKAMNDLGVRGVRVNFLTAQSWGVTTIERLQATAKRIAPLGWQAQLLMSGDQIAANEAAIAALPVPVVFDHLGRIPEPAGVDHPGAHAILRLLQNGRTWIKLSEPYADTKTGAPEYSDTSALVRAYIAAAPERAIWGSDWPHPTEKEKPDDAVLFDLMSTWAPDAALREKILVSNPARLFGFG